jgi:hypothetical protein
MKAYWGVEVLLHTLFTSVLCGDEWSALSPRVRVPGTHCIGGWVGPRAGLDAVVKRKIPSSHRKSNPRTPIVQPIAQRYTDWALTALGPLNFSVTNCALMVRYLTRIFCLSPMWTYKLLDVNLWKCTYINTCDWGPHRIFRLEKVAYGKDEVGTTALHQGCGGSRRCERIPE